MTSGSGLDRHTFDHVGIPTAEPHEGEIYVAENKVWLTSPRDHPAHVEWLRWEEGSPAPEPVTRLPHVAFRVPDLEAAMAGREVLTEPFDIGTDFCRVAFIVVDGGVVELMQYRDPDETGWF
jgi:hypothetical protein